MEALSSGREKPRHLDPAWPSAQGPEKGTGASPQSQRPRAGFSQKSLVADSWVACSRPQLVPPPQEQARPGMQPPSPVHMLLLPSCNHGTCLLCVAPPLQPSPPIRSRPHARDPAHHRAPRSLRGPTHKAQRAGLSHAIPPTLTRSAHQARGHAHRGPDSALLSPPLPSFL